MRVPRGLPLSHLCTLRASCSIDLTLVDPSTVPNGYQKVTVFFFIISSKLLFSSMVNDPYSAELYEKQGTFEKLMQQLRTGMLISFLTLPVTVFLDRMFNKQQKHVHGKAAHGASVSLLPLRGRVHNLVRHVFSSHHELHLHCL